MKRRSLGPSIFALLALSTGLQASSTIYLGTNFGPYKSTDSGVTFTQLTVNVSNPFIQAGLHAANSIAVDPKNSNAVYFGSSSGFYKSTDGGQTWSAVVPAGFTFSTGSGVLAIDPVMTNVIYSVAYNGNNFVVIKSIDSGVTWNAAGQAADGSSILSIAIDPSHSGVLYAVSQAHIYKTANFGATWTQQASAPAVEFRRVYVDPHNSLVLYGSTGFRNSNSANCATTINGGQCGLFKSSDGGTSWTGINIQGSIYATGLAFDAGTDTLYAAVALTGLGKTLMKSTDGGSSWTPLYNEFSAVFAFTVHTDPTAAGSVYVTTDAEAKGFFRSTDGGADWTRVTQLGCNLPVTPTCTNLVTIVDFAVGAPAAAPPPPVTGPTRTISHIANGAGWRTTAILINTGTQAESFELKFWDDSGNPLVLDLGADGMTADFIDTIQPGVARFLRTAGTGVNLIPGWAELTSPLDIDGNSIFGLQTPGQGDSEAAVPLSSSGGTELFVPFDYSTGYSTGIAFANPGLQFATVSATILDDIGQNVPASNNISVPARGHYSDVVASKYPGVVGKRGVAHFSSTASISGLGIRANGKAFTSIEALTGVTNANKIIPHIANGGGWKTTFLIVCAGSQASNFTLSFWKDGGTALTLPLGVDGTVSSITDIIEPGEVRIIQTTDTGPTVQGWAQLTGLTGAVSGTAIFALQSPGQSDSEAAVPFATTASTHLFMPYDYTTGYSTAIAFANTTPNQLATLTFTFTDDTGHVLSSGIQINVQGNGHGSAVLGTLLPSIAGTRGTVSITSTVPVVGLGIRADGVAFTSLKVINK